ncbi:hypothetical protein CC79DRAFT_748328 [Sarocladium strictum]
MRRGLSEKDRVPQPVRRRRGIAEKKSIAMRKLRQQRLAPAGASHCTTRRTTLGLLQGSKTTTGTSYAGGLWHECEVLLYPQRSSSWCRSQTCPAEAAAANTCSGSSGDFTRGLELGSTRSEARATTLRLC